MTSDVPVGPMGMTSKRSLFINLPVKDLAKTKAFWTKLGFTFNAQFTDDKAACMVLSDLGFVMLLSEPFFKTFTTKSIADTSKVTEALFTVSCESREEVDQMVKTAAENGGTPGTDKQDHGFMYEWSFFDLEGHGWGVMYMDPSHVQKS